MPMDTFERSYPHIQGSLRGSLFYLERRRRKEQTEAWQNLDDNWEPPPTPVGDAASSVKLQVMCRQGRWIVQCPGCKAAQKASTGVPMFYCDVCRNPGTDPPHLRVHVEWPEDWEAIDAVLDCRPARAFQNWLPGETLADIVAENEAAGWPVPEGV